MKEKLRALVTPAYLLLCLLIGGSTQGVWANMILRLLALAILAWAFLRPRREPASRAERQLQLLIGVGLAWIAVHLVPLPPMAWTKLPARDFVADGFALLGHPLPWLPIALAPYAALSTVLALLPPLAILAAMLRQRAYTPAGLAWVIAAAAAAGVVLGALQVTTAEPATLKSPWYLYRVTNLGAATGFFANSNHMATLLVTTLPFLAALAVAARGRGDRHRFPATAVLVAGIGAIITLGILLNGSLAGLALGVPVLLASALLVLKRRVAGQGPALLVLAAVMVIVVGGLSTAPMRSAFTGREATASVESRQEIYRTSAAIARDFAPIGAGLGSFAKVYPRYEDPDHVDISFVNHAHNDYLELAVELGLPGIALFLLFLLWWAAAAVKPWRTASTDAFARAGTIASAAILAHSFVDFPLRTSAIGGLFAACLVLMVRPWVAPARAAAGELRPSRHLSVE